jgi:hypothetical protein
LQQAGIATKWAGIATKWSMHAAVHAHGASSHSTSIKYAAKITSRRLLARALA